MKKVRSFPALLNPWTQVKLQFEAIYERTKKILVCVFIGLCLTENWWYLIDCISMHRLYWEHLLPSKWISNCSIRMLDKKEGEFYLILEITFGFLKMISFEMKAKKCLQWTLQVNCDIKDPFFVGWNVGFVLNTALEQTLISYFW